MSNRPGYSNVRVVSSRPVAEQGYYENDRYYEERGPVVRRDANRPVREVEYEVERDYVEGGDRYYTTSDRRVTRQSPQQRVVTESAYSSRVPSGYTNTNVSYVSPRLYASDEHFDISDDDVVYEEHFEDQYDWPAYYDENRTTTYAGATSALDYIDERRSKSGRRKWNPICDMGETPTYWLIRCEIPGVRKDRLQVAVEGKDLIIKGKRFKELWNLDKLGASTTPAPTTNTTASGAATTTTAPATATKFTPDARMSGVNWINKERGGKGTFKRRVRLPERVDDSAIQALYKDGILEVLVKKPEAQARKQAKAAAQAKAVAIQHS